MATSIQHDGREIMLPRGWEHNPEMSKDSWQWIQHPEWGAIGVSYEEGRMEVRDSEGKNRVTMPLKGIVTGLRFVSDI